MLDGESVVIGDTVFVQGVGAGTVIRVEADGGFVVKTGNGQQHYRSGGMIGNVRKVYWHDPVIVTPPKNLRLWNAFVAMAKTDYAQVKGLFETGAVPEMTVDEA